MRELGPDEGMNALRHPDCRYCDEYQRLLRGVALERDQWKERALKTESSLAGTGEERPGEGDDAEVKAPRLLKLALYWAVAYKLACDEMFRKRGPSPQDVAAFSQLHRELFGDSSGGGG